VSTSRTLVQPAPPSQKIIGIALIVASLAYLFYFVPRGWVPHDEGMLGQAAERVLRGGLPHVDYVELYTGGLAWLNAQVFRVFGVDLIYLRWLLFAGAVVAQWLTYALLRRFLKPAPAALASWIALVWSFPNFFAGLPSWWLLICALGSLLAFVRYVESGAVKYAAIAGLAAGLSLLIKQTGIYLLIALMMSLLYENVGGRAGVEARFAHILRIGVATLAIAFALFILHSRMFPSDLLYLLLPIAACSRLLVTSPGSGGNAPNDRRWLAVVSAGICAIIPLACFLVPYIASHHLRELINGLVVAPQKRFVFANIDMDSAWFILTGLPLAALFVPIRMLDRIPRISPTVVGAMSAIAALLIVAASLANEDAYQAVWQSARAFAALLPIAVCWRLISGHVADEDRRRLLFAICTMLSWAALVQFPFSAPIYFCYVTPLVVLAAVATGADASGNRKVLIGAWSGLVFCFAVLSMNRGYIYNLGQNHDPQAFTADLDLSRAHVRVTPHDADAYRRLVDVISTHAGSGKVVAGPDCPEIYFLMARVNPSGALFDFLSEESADDEGVGDSADWRSASVTVINHQAPFSRRPSPQLVAAVRDAFPSGALIAQFEVRWR